MRASADRRKDDRPCHVTASEGASPPRWPSPARLRREFPKVSAASLRVDHRAALSFPEDLRHVHSLHIKGFCF